jgi:hypothetical protein
MDWLPSFLFTLITQRSARKRDNEALRQHVVVKAGNNKGEIKE